MEPTPELLDRWVAGFGASRSLAKRRYGRGWRVEVAAETRALEYFIVLPSADEVRHLTSKVMGRPDVWLTVVGEISDESAEILSVLERMTQDELMMSSPIAPVAMPDRIILAEDGLVARVHVVVEGETAATGQAAVVGTDVIFDRIGVTPRFQRRGLGSVIMVGLTSWAADLHATTGILLASVDGRHLYSSLGWSEVRPIATFRGVDFDNARTELNPPGRTSAG